MKKILLLIVFLFFFIGFESCSSSRVRTSKSSDSNYGWARNYKNNFQSTYYADKFNGKKTSNGTTFSNNKLTGAHRTLPFGTKVRVTNLANKETVIVEINDRGPQKLSREIDLSKKAFMAITDNKNNGVLNVKIEILN